MTAILAGCFPNCTPPPGSGVSMNGGSNYALGAAVVLIAILLLTTRSKSGK